MTSILNIGEAKSIAEHRVNCHLPVPLIVRMADASIVPGVREADLQKECPGIIFGYLTWSPWLFG
jgi:hypothetical protein